MAVLAGAIWLTVLSVIDIRRQRLPDVLTLPGAAVVLLSAAAHDRAAAALCGAVALAGLYLMAFLVGGMGGGDVKLALGLGAVTGAVGLEAWLLAALVAPLLTVIWAVAARSRVVPHGPSMCLATALAVWLTL